MKIDDQSNYLEFPGVTIIADAGQTNQKLWQDIYYFLKNTSVLCNYFSPLPYQSYHMTTCNLYTQQETPENWLSFISKKLTIFQKMNKRLLELNFNISISVEAVNYFSELQLILSIPSEQQTIIQQFAEEFGLKNKIPTVFHITLAYGYREIEDEQVFKEIKNKMEELLKICQQYEQKIILSPPKLCFFRSMEQFIPWDGAINPFIVKSSANPLRLFSSEKGMQKNEVAKPSFCITM
ncbi:DUF1868 domain-containing protein [Legionella bozemanae]|uniref:DUF1868 domain-containing protein n=1 Tax=Legionella bozemanae TaxID=447 RepID=A0A0W0RVN7_LEGBO|nr:DUF1868 domain-containing protein [Legionella bozemanae]KTC75099.1 hypothetical protein Lboz_1086 [Legionella bozemanae]STO35120.1 Uncharacterized protein conserved in bacteria [Legionella bozemanae]